MENSRPSLYDWLHFLIHASRKQSQLLLNCWSPHPYPCSYCSSPVQLCVHVENYTTNNKGRTLSPFFQRKQYATRAQLILKHSFPYLIIHLLFREISRALPDSPLVTTDPVRWWRHYLFFASDHDRHLSSNFNLASYNRGNFYLLTDVM